WRATSAPAAPPWRPPSEVLREVPRFPRDRHRRRGRPLPRRPRPRNLLEEDPRPRDGGAGGAGRALAHFPHCPPRSGGAARPLALDPRLLPRPPRGRG